MTLKKAVSIIENKGALLVFPIKNKQAPSSLWTEFYPRKKMRWEWDDDADNDVVVLWHLRAELADSGQVVYAKWYQGRATLFSKEAFAACLHLLRGGESEYFQRQQLSSEAKLVLEQLEEDSPQSTKTLKKNLRSEFGLETKNIEKGLKELWKKLLIVGYGEVDDGAFPSLAVGATSVLWESLWAKSLKMDELEAKATLEELGVSETPFYHYLTRSIPGPRAKSSAAQKNKNTVRYEDLIRKST